MGKHMKIEILKLKFKIKINLKGRLNIIIKIKNQKSTLT